MNYTVKLTKDSAEVVGLPDVYLHFAHHDFAIVWNKETKRQDVVRPADTFYGSNVGEGQTFKTWQDAIHASLYDYFQYGEEFHDGDTFTVEYLGETTRFVCDGFHVIPVSEWDSQIPKTIAERANKVASIYHYACDQLRNTFQINRFGNMVERYGRNLPAYTRATNAVSESFDIITTGIYEGKKGTESL